MSGVSKSSAVTTTTTTMMEQDKPFKTIEVIDNDTKQVCKIACMSCIRGHRTTSCGIPVCRTKLFWTVKRPGRPSNSCTCRFNASGVCKCVTALPKCPHKLKKGEKRTNECRCDEQGRFCCLLDPEHWDSLMKMQKPMVQFFSNREELENWQTAQSGQSVYAATPQMTESCCSSTRQSTPRTSRSIAPSPAEGIASPLSSVMTPRFGFMTPATPDVWKSEIQIAPSEFSAIASPEPESNSRSCCQSSSNPYTPPVQPFDTAPYQNYPDPYAYIEASSERQPVFDFDRWNQNYQMYQYPNAICQNCGLNGCTCRSCPPLMQNFGTTSWAQSCGRRHARIAPMPVSRPQEVIVNPQMMHGHPVEHNIHCQSELSTQQQDTSHLEHDLISTSNILPQHIQSLPFHTLQQSMLIDDMNGFTDHAVSAGGIADPILYNDFLLHEFEQPIHNDDEHMFGG